MKAWTPPWFLDHARSRVLATEQPGSAVLVQFACLKLRTDVRWGCLVAVTLGSSGKSLRCR